MCVVCVHVYVRLHVCECVYECLCMSAWYGACVYECV